MPGIRIHYFSFPLLRIAVAVNGVVQHRWNGTEYKARCHYASYNNDICVLWDDEEWAQEKEKKEDVEFAIRLVEEGGRIAVIALTHVYYA